MVDTFAKAIQTGDAKGAIEKGERTCRADLRPLDAANARRSGEADARPFPVVHQRMPPGEGPSASEHSMSVVTAGTRRPARAASCRTGAARARLAGIARRSSPTSSCCRALLILVLFMAYPFFLGIWLSLTNKLVGFSDYDFVGLDNFRWFWTTPIFRRPSKTPSSTASSPCRSSCCWASAWPCSSTSVPLQPLHAGRPAVALDRANRDQQPRLVDALRGVLSPISWI